MPEAPDHWSASSEASARRDATRIARDPMCRIELANRKLSWVYLDANWSFYRRCSPAEKEQDEPCASKALWSNPAFLRWALLMRAIK